MNSGTKVFLALAGAGAAVGTVLLVSMKSAKAAPKLPAEPAPPEVVVVPEPDAPPDTPPVVVPEPAAAPAIDTAEASRLLLRWWAAEGESLLFSEEDRDKLRSRGFPVDFGTAPDDLGAIWGPRKRDISAAFQRLSGLSPDDGAPSQKLCDALVRWAKSQELPPATPATSPNEPASQVISAPNQEPVVVVPEPAPIPPAAPPTAGPPPFVRQPSAAPESLLPPLAVPISLPPASAVVPEPAVVLAVEPPAPIVATPAAIQPAPVPSDTAALVSELLAAESAPGWKRKYESVGAWQKSRGLKVDKMYGPKTAKAVAAEIGTVPIVRYWPAGSDPVKVVPQFKLELLELAKQAEEPRRSQLLISAKRERGQAFDPKQIATALPEFERVQIAQVA
jgi:hypothetical protein